MKVALFLATGYEEGEVIIIGDLLRRAGCHVDLINIENKALVTSVNNFQLKSNKFLSNTKYDDYKAFILPGGMDGVNNLKNNKWLQKWIIQANDDKKIIGAICAAPIILEKWGLLTNKNYTVHPSCEPLITSGILNTTDAVVIDDNIVTCPSLGCAFNFSLALVNILVSSTRALEMKTNLIFRT